MKLSMWVIFFTLSSFSFLYSQSVVIKSLQTYAGDNQTSFPVILQNGVGPKYITIEFDVQSKFDPSLDIVFRFCDRNWIPYQNFFLMNPGKSIAYNLYYTTLPHTVKDAKFHFINSFPDNKGYVEFPFSGKWMYFITDSQDTSKIYAHGKFFVIQRDISVNDTLKYEQLEDKVYFPSDLSKVFGITTNFTIPDNMYPAYVNDVEIITNQVMDYPTVVDRNGNTNTRQYYWDGNRKFSFIARDLLPGNEYRQVDLRNTDKFIAKDVTAQFDGLEYSRFYKEGPSDLNGASILMNYDNSYATYLNVAFSIRPPNDVAGNIYLVGAFNKWKISPKYEMKDDYGIYSITIPLKRGVYDYQYVIANIEDGQITSQDWVTLEGNSWQTNNEYNIFVYYKDPNYGGYDKIIGYQKIMSNSRWKN